MKYRTLGKTGFAISEISLGTWQLGGKWGESFDEATAMRTLEAAYDNGVNFFDTADIYQNGMSERAIGKFVKSKDKRIYVTTKCGRKLNPHNAEGYNARNIRNFVEESLRNMDMECLDLVLLHCPPTEVYNKDEVFDELEKLKTNGLIANYGVSVEKIEEAKMAMEIYRPLRLFSTCFAFALPPSCFRSHRNAMSASLSVYRLQADYFPVNIPSTAFLEKTTIAHTTETENFSTKGKHSQA